MLVEDYISALRQDGERFADALSSADPSAAVPSCPEWTVRELAHHTGRVHRWAASYPRDQLTRVLTEAEESTAWGAMPDDRSLVDWFREGHARLVEVLRSASPDVACWTFLPAPSPLAFWARRQAHETSVHRVDAELAVARMTPVDRDFAVDGVDELLLCFFSRRRNRMRSDEPRTLSLVATDAPAYWLVDIGPDGARAQRRDAPAEGADAAVSGSAAALYLGLWNRGPLGDREGDNAGVVLTGDRTLVDRWRALATVTWS